ncbi:MAG: iron-sulfur cluster repair di-iron protein [Rhodothermaceae bacterium]|nr:MAG: iron-sulfur cluster repair di-iron protein [Rhodothermaceae bacterium]
MEPTNLIEWRNRTVGDVVAEDYRRAAIFKRFGIDFCCGGGLTVEAACERKGIDYQEVAQALLAFDSAGSGTTEPDPRSWSPDFLCDYIVNVHHRYVREHLPTLVQFSHKVARVHGKDHPELIEMADLVEALREDLQQHMMKEEQVLFPYVKALVAARIQEVPVNPPPFGSVRNPIRVMEHEHDRAGELMKHLRTLSDNFTPPEHACNTYRALFALLEAFEADLHRHVHLENNILFPEAARLEQELIGPAEA